MKSARTPATSEGINGPHYRINGIRLYTLRPPLVCIAGLAATHDTWRGGKSPNLSAN